MDLTELLIQEREASIDDILTQTVQVNEVFKDLAALVDEQGTLLDTIDTNVSSAKTATEGGVTYLTQAAKYAAKYRCCLIWMLAIIFFAVVAGVIAAVSGAAAQRRSARGRRRAPRPRPHGRTLSPRRVSPAPRLQLNEKCVIKIGDHCK